MIGKGSLSDQCEIDNHCYLDHCHGNLNIVTFVARIELVRTYKDIRGIVNISGLLHCIIP